MRVYDTENYVKKILKDPAVRVMSIGPAGENLVRFASVSSDYSRQAARGGSGAVLGSKKVKAIAVKGTRDIPIANFSSFLLLVKKAREVIFNNPWVPDQRKYGTPRTVTPVNANGLLPVNNFTEGAVESVASIDEFAVEALDGKRLSCGECPVACAKGYNRGKFAIEGPEYETIALLGPNIGVLDLNEIAEFNYYCNQYGLDTMSTGALIGALLASGKIKIAGEEKKKQTIIKLLNQISYREGVGDVLAEGLRFVGKKWGISYLMPEVKGLGIPAYDPRCSDGTALVYMTADRGACHLRSWPLGRELASIWGKDDLNKKIDFIRNQQDEKAAEESLIVCQFAYGIGLLNEILPEMVNEATGEDWDLAKMKIAGERIWNLSKLFNIKEGMSRKDDYLPEKFAVEGIKSGPLKGKVISREKQDFMLDKYYELRGWTKKGVPTPETLKRLGIEEEI
jgi:aldehyde:ferredoxin oxidoreductase